MSKVDDLFEELINSPRKFETLASEGGENFLITSLLMITADKNTPVDVKRKIFKDMWDKVRADKVISEKSPYEAFMEEAEVDGNGDKSG